MPNFPLSDPIRHHITNQVTRLAERPCAQIRSLFPLTHDEIQKLVLDDKTCADLQDLVNRGVQTIVKHGEIRLAFLGASDESRLRIPELKRSMVLFIEAARRSSISDKNHGWFVKYSTQYGVRKLDEFNINNANYITADINQIPQDRKIKLLEWLDRALHQERIKEVAEKVTQAIVQRHAATTTHLQVLFPALARVIDAESTNAREREYWGKWVEKLRNPARNIYNYLPEPWVELTYKPLFPVVENAINAGKLIGHDIVRDGSKIQAKVEHWEYLPRDVKFPLPRKFPEPIEIQE